MTWTLSGFADEISPDLDEQLDTLAAESMHYLELRGVWGTNVAELTDEQLGRIERRLAERDVRVSSIGSPLGKVDITQPFAAERARAKRIFEVAQRLGAPIVRVFSFYRPTGTEPEAYRDQIIANLAELSELAQAAGLVLAHENEKGIYGDVPSRCLDLLASVDSPAFRSTFDAANFVQCGVRPFDEGYEPLRPYLIYMQIKDALAANGQVTPAGEGDGQVRQTLQALAESGFDGFFSLEPHLRHAGRAGGFSGPELFRQAVQALKKLLDELGIAWQ